MSYSTRNRGHSVSATWPTSGRTYNYSSILALAKVLSGTGKPSGGLQATIAKNAYHGMHVRGVRVQYI